MRRTTQILGVLLVVWGIGVAFAQDTYKSVTDAINAKRAELYKLPADIKGDQAKRLAFSEKATIKYYCMRIEETQKYIAAHATAHDIWDARLGLAECRQRLAETLQRLSADSEMNGQPISKAEAARLAPDLVSQYKSELKGIVEKAHVDNQAGILARGLLWKETALGSEPLAFSEKGVDGEELSPESFKGKVLLLDFWATWCGPCIAELPNVQKAYEMFHEKGLEIISISLDRAEDEAKYKTFIKEKNMPWHHIYDGNYWDAKLARRYGVRAIPTMYVVGRDGKITAASPRGEGLLKAIEEALNK